MDSPIDRGVRRIAVLLLCAAVSLCAASSASAASGPRAARTAGALTTSGTVRLVSIDRADGSFASHWVLDSGSRTVRLSAPGVNLNRFADRWVRVSGALQGGVLSLRAGSIAPSRRPVGPAQSATAGTAGHTTAVVLLNVNGNSPGTAAAATQDVFSTSNAYSVKNYWLTQTYGKVDLVGKKNAAGDVLGPYAVNSCDLNQGPNEATAIASQHGYDLSTYQSVVWVFPTMCGGGGEGEQPGHQVWIYGLNPYVVSHELGHNFGNPHASTLRCYTDAGKTAAATLSSVCDPPDEYGDPFDPMGGGGTFPNCSVSGGNDFATPYEMDPWRKLNIGAMTLGDAPTENVAGTHTYTLKPLETSSGLRLIRLPDGRGDGRMFDLSFRQPIGTFDQWYDHPLDANNDGNRQAIDGVRLAMDPSPIASQSQQPLANTDLLDTTPDTAGQLTDPCTSSSPSGCDPCVNEPPGCASNQFFNSWVAENACTNLPMSGFEDAPLATGKTWSDPLTGLTVAIGAVGSSGAQVTVTYAHGTGPDVSAPTAPAGLHAALASGIVTLSWSASVDTLDGVSHYVVLRDGKVIQGSVASLHTTDKPGPGKHTYTVRAADAAGNLGPASAPASVTISSPKPPPPPPVKCTVPKLKGKTLKAAKSALARAHCKLGRVTHKHSRKVRKGHVISQNPRPGLRKPARTKVAVVLSRGR